MRNPVRNAVLFGVITVVSIVLVLLGVADMRGTRTTGSPLLALGLFPALLCSIFFIYYLGKIRVFRDMRSARSAIARWTLPAEQFNRFCEEQKRIPARSIMTNFYRPPKTSPAAGVDVIFSDDGVLIGGGYFPLSNPRETPSEREVHRFQSPGYRVRYCHKYNGQHFERYDQYLPHCGSSTRARVDRRHEAGR